MFQRKKKKKTKKKQTKINPRKQPKEETTFFLWIKKKKRDKRNKKKGNNRLPKVSHLKNALSTKNIFICFLFLLFSPSSQKPKKRKQIKRKKKLNPTLIKNCGKIYIKKIYSNLTTRVTEVRRFKKKSGPPFEFESIFLLLWKKNIENL